MTSPKELEAAVEQLTEFVKTHGADCNPAIPVVLDALASITRERDAMREGLRDALPWAEMGFYLWDACSFTAGDRRTEPEERTITWQWQQVLPDDHDWSAMRSDIEKFLADLTEDTETSPWVLDLPVIRAAALVNGGEEISSKALPSKGLGGFERAKEISLCAAWLDECARYFEKRPTNGEDAAHWANVANAVNARKYAALVRSFAALVNGEGGE